MTPPMVATRRGAIDVARLGALVLVVVGHLALAIIDRGLDGSLRGANLIARYPGLAWAALLAPMPIFFAAAGWANAASSPTTTAVRVRPLIGLAAVVVTGWSIASMAELAIRGSGGIVADGARIATQPLWFLAAYVPFCAAGSQIARLARRPAAAIGSCLGILAALDALRFNTNVVDAVGWLGFYLAWGVPWLLGAVWRHRHETGRIDERRTGVVLAVGGAAACVLLTARAGYFPSLIDVINGKRSNTTPPTLFTAIAAITQVGLLLVAAPNLDRVARRWHRLIERGGSLAGGLYVWHLTSLALCAALAAAVHWTPARFSSVWWITRPIWFGLVICGAVALAMVSGQIGTRRHQSEQASTRLTTLSCWMALVLATAGAAEAGLWGPRTVTGAAGGTLAFVLASWCLRLADGTARTRTQ